MSERRRVVVTGAGGFIGTALCGEFVRSGWDVRALVGPPGSPLVAPAGTSAAAYAEIDDADALDALLRGVDIVVHAAGPPSVGASFRDPVGYTRAHTGGTAAVLEACRRSGVNSIVYISSAEVYGRPQTDPVSESHPLAARSPYAAAKIGAEQMVLAFHHAYGIGATILRPFSVYGPAMGEHSLLRAIFRQVNGSSPMRLANLVPVRDYCHVDDVARAIRLAAEHPTALPIVCNIGSGSGTSVGDLAATVVRLAGIERAIEQDSVDDRPASADILRLVSDPRRAAAELGWRPAISLEDGLHEMLATLGVSA